MFIESIIGTNVTIGSIELLHFDEEDNITHFVDIELEQFEDSDIEKLKLFVEKNK